MEQHHHHHAPSLGVDLDPLDLMGFGAIFSFSFAASLHCAFMCSPLVCAALGERAKLNRFGIWLYNIGRLCSYSGAGYLLGSGSEWLVGFRPSWGLGFSRVLGVFIIIVALSKLWEILFKKPLLSFSRGGAKRFSGAILNSSTNLPAVLKDFSLGMITVALPCMTLTPALATAAGSGDSVKGFLFMLAFGLGTLPIMLGATYVPLVFKGKVSDSTAKALVVLFLLVAGIITIIRH